MNKFNAQSLLFALVVLLSVLLSRNEGSLEIKKSTISKVQATSLTAQVSDLVPLGPPPSAVASPKTVLPPADTKTVFLAEPESAILNSPPAVQAAAGLVKEIGTSRVLWEKSASRRWPLASLTKLMTAVVTLENLELDQRIAMTERTVAADGNVGGFRSGEIFAVYDLLKTMILISSNDAAAALAEFYGTSDFLERMQAKTFELGMNQTTFFDPSGLSVLNQSTVLDLEKLINYIRKIHPQILEISRLKGSTLIELGSRTPRTIFSNNQFSGRPEFLGGKTGYIDESDGNLISLWQLGNRDFLIIVLGSNDRFGETEKLFSWLKSNF